MQLRDLRPDGPPDPVCEPGAFGFAAVGLDHPHAHAMVRGLVGAGGTLRLVYDPDPDKVAALLRQVPEARVARSEQEVLDRDDVALVASAAVPSARAALALRVLDAGKDVFLDKPAVTTLAQLEALRSRAAATGRKVLVYFGERVHVEGAVVASEIVEAGVLGRVLQVVGFGPHRLGLHPRPAWFYRKADVGGILCDLGSHQFDQVLHYSRSTGARIGYARVENLGHPAAPELEDFGEANVLTDGGSSGYVRVDWFTPDGLRTWGDGRLFLLGTRGTLELRRYLDVARGPGSDHLYLVTDEGEHHLQVEGRVGFPFFGRAILDCLDRTETAMTQAHAFAATELALRAQEHADRRRAPRTPASPAPAPDPRGGST